uniref:Reverse transcriptase domain-containing protein n=1 Tax=Graphocephala atropunctata TaxID=36148 RepID=A0A1B6M3N2_9HEMI
MEHSISDPSRNCNYVSKVISQVQTVRHGVPQGSIRGPLWFLCYLRGLPGVMSVGGAACLYADDTNITVRGDSKESIEIASFLNLSNAKGFLDSKNLLINPNKSNFISSCTKQTQDKLSPNIFLDDKKLDQVECTKFLGLLIDEHLSWDKHIDHVVNRMSSGLYAMRQLYKICNSKTLLTIYYSLVHSHLAYGISLYGATKKGNLDRILLQQKRGIRIMHNLKKTDSVKNLFIELGILTVYGLYILETATYAKQLVNETSDEYRHPYNTRFHRNVDRHNLEFYKKKTKYIGNRFLHCLPRTFLTEANNKLFKNKLKDYLIRLAPYSLEEFGDSL